MFTAFCSFIAFLMFIWLVRRQRRKIDRRKYQEDLHGDPIKSLEVQLVSAFKSEDYIKAFKLLQQLEELTPNNAIAKSLRDAIVEKIQDNQ